MSLAEVHIRDASKRSADPGRTAGLRKGFRAAADMQLNQLRASLRQALVEFNVLGLDAGGAMGNYSFQEPGARLNQFAGWLENAANASLDARWWVHPWLDKATQHGLGAAQQELQGVEYQPVPTTFASLHELARHELRGLIAVLVQKVVRQAHGASIRRLAPHQAFRAMAKTVDGDIRNRLQLFAQHFGQKGHIHGKAEYYRQVGIRQFGINPELHNPRRKLVKRQVSGKLYRYTHDAEPADVTWVTADDDLVCPQCEEMAMGSPYSLDEVMDLMPLHANCRCDLTTYDGPEEQDFGDADVDFTKGEGGRFTGSIGHGGKGKGPSPPVPHPHDPQLSAHYSLHAHVVNGVIQTDSVYDATRALYEGRDVRLKQPKQVSTLVKHLGAVAARMATLHMDAPNFDLCHVAIKGTNLFCADTAGIPRIKMPQMSKLQTKAFIVDLIKKGYGVEKDTEKVSHMRATQNQLIGVKVANNVQRMKADPSLMQRRLVISKDDYVLDGHHKWAAVLAIDAKNNKLGDLKMRVYRVNIDIVRLLKLALAFTGGKGAEGVEKSDRVVTKKVVAKKFVAKKAALDFDPDEPRDWHGRWGSGGGASGSTLAFHGTTEEVASKIIKEGIKVNPTGRSFVGQSLYTGPRGESVYVAERLSSAIDWAQRRSDENAHGPIGRVHPDLVVFELNIPKDEWQKFKQDEVVPIGAARAELNIPPAWIVKATGYDAFDVDGEHPHDIPLHDAWRDAGHVVRYMAILVARKRKHDALWSDAPVEFTQDPLTGRFTGSTGHGFGAVEIDSELTDVGGDEWNRNIASKLEIEYQRVKPELEKLATKVVEEGGSETKEEKIETWEQLGNDAQETTKSKYIDNSYESEYENEVNNWHDNGEAMDDAKHQLIYDLDKKALDKLDWFTDAIKEVREQREEDGQSRIPYTDEQLWHAISISSEPGYGYEINGKHDEVIFDNAHLQDPDNMAPSGQQLEFAGIPPADRADQLSPDMREQLELSIKAAFQTEAKDNEDDVEAPDYLSDSAKESLNDYFDQMDDDEKFKQAEAFDQVPEPEEVVENVEYPGDGAFDPLDKNHSENNINYKKTGVLGRAMSVDRATDLLMQRDPKLDHSDAARIARHLDSELWADWKSSSTSSNGLLMQKAVSLEFNTHFRSRGEGYDLDPEIRRAAGSFGGMKYVQAYLRAKWETSQWLLDKAGDNTVELYRTVSVDDTGREETVFGPQKVNYASGQKFIRLPDLPMKRNGAYSTSTDVNMANNWDGQGRTVLRFVMPRTSLLGLPCYGQNIYGEHEVVAFGGAIKKWDAWEGKAPPIADVPFGATALPDPRELPPDLTTALGTAEAKLKNEMKPLNVSLTPLETKAVEFAHGGVGEAWQKFHPYSNMGPDLASAEAKIAAEKTSQWNISFTPTEVTALNAAYKGGIIEAWQKKLANAK